MEVNGFHLSYPLVCSSGGLREHHAHGLVNRSRCKGSRLFVTWMYQGPVDMRSGWIGVLASHPRSVNRCEALVDKRQSSGPHNSE